MAGSGHFVDIEWATLCAEILTDEEPSRVDLIGVNAAGVNVENEPPVDVPVNVAVCLFASPDEVVAGGVVRVSCGVRAPDGTPAGGTVLLWAYEEGANRPHPELPGRHVVPVTFAFRARVEGVYSVRVQIEGNVPHTLPYAVRRYSPDAG